MAKLPRVVYIAGHRIPIRVLDLPDCYGQYLPDEKVIQIDRATAKDPETFRQTLRHEMVEASLCLSGVYWSEIYEQEPIVRALDELFWPAWEKLEKKLKN